MRGTIIENKNDNKLDELAQTAQQILFKASTVFPFEIFPTTIIVDALKVSVVGSGPFGSANTHSVSIPNITDVLGGYSMFLGSVEINVGVSQEVVNVKHLWKEDAKRARSIILGLTIAHKEQVDLTQFPNTHELVERLILLGSSKH